MQRTARGWRPDVLPGYRARDLLLDAGPAVGEPESEAAPLSRLVATLVRRVADRDRPRAVLYVHGWNDYFFQTHLADAWADLGYAFYALDLRRYGRSLRPGQYPGYVTDLGHYAAELDSAYAVIGAEHDEVVLMGHSTGGLVLTLHAHDRPGRYAGLVLNSPWLDLQGSPWLRAVGTPVIDRLGGARPTTALRLPDLGLYGRSLHVSRDGEWDYDLQWKTSPSPPVRVGWLRAVLQGHQRVAAGLDVDCPVLVLCSARSALSLKIGGLRWQEELRTADVVLDVEQIARRAVRLGRNVTLLRFDGGLHDLVLSAPDVRRQVLDDLGRWVGGYLTRSGPVVAERPRL